jgi:primosomal protein N' (replication factor Y)
MSAELAEVIVTLPVQGRYHYVVPPHMAGRARVGSRVLVRFGTRKVTGVVVRGSSRPPEGVELAELSEILDDEPSLSNDLLELCLWVAEYYEAPAGEALKAALPAGSGVAARKMLVLTEAGRVAAAGEGTAVGPKQRAVLEKLLAGNLAVAGLTEATRKQVEAMRERGWIEEQEQRDEARVRLKRERIARLAAGADVAAARAALARSPKRLAAFDKIAAGETLVGSLDDGAAVTRALAKAGYVVVEEREAALGVAAIGEGMIVNAPPELMPEQAAAVGTITEAMKVPLDKFTPFLLHGVTGSGKTEVYLRVIAEALAVGKTAVVLVPEISLTPQLAARFRARFGDQVAILHSGLSDQARLGEWSRLHRGEARIAVGARSAVFAPVANIGVIVVDEEHDSSFKQEEGVRYHARDVALVRAQRSGAVCVLGSATPSLESFAQAERGNYRRLVLTSRPTARPMPEVQIVDLRVHLPDGDAMLSAPLRAAIGETLAAGDQTILFLNRRGFSTFVLCKACGHAFRCKNCSVSMTYHRHSDSLRCHYCGHFERIPTNCPSCGAKDTILRKGMGTEKVAESIAAEFPQARVGRLDRDVASGAKVETVLARVARREIDILVGTQMVTKGHDFPGVTLVGVLCADTGLNIPDFRASERTFQLLAQVAGRAGRGDRPGRVLVQTYRPSAHAVVSAAAHDYDSFFRAESAARAELAYPPHGRLIAVRIDGPEPGTVSKTGERLAMLAATVAKRPEIVGVEVLGPVAAPLEKLRGRTRWQIWLRGADRTALRRVARSLLTAELPANVRVSLDVDPMSAL